MRLLRERSERLVVVVGPSGAGKDAVLSAWLSSLPHGHRPHQARRVITRARHDDSEAHEAIDAAGFSAAASAGQFAFTWSAHGLDYGIRWSELAPLQQGRWVVMNGSRSHLPTLRHAAPRSRVVEIVASDAVRSARLTSRRRENETAVRARLVRRTPEAAPDLCIRNDGALDAAVAQLGAWWQRL